MGKIWDFSLYGSNTAISDGADTQVSYSELDLACSKASSLNDDKGLAMMFASNTVGAITAYSSILNSGIPIMLISDALTDDMKNHLMKVYRPLYLIIPAEQRNNYTFDTEVMAFYDYVVLKTNYPDTYPVNGDLGLLLTTSGSTGSVKFVRQSYGNILFNARAHADYLGITSADRTITALPMHYTYGLSLINTTLLKGGTMVVTTKSIMEDEFWDLLKDEKVTSFHGVPGTYDMLYRIGILEDDFADIRLLTQAGGKLSENMHEYFSSYARDHGIEFIIMYGQCEATAAISYLSSEVSLEKKGSVGKVIPGGRIILKDSQGQAITEAGTEGEIIYEGPNVTMGYAECGEDLIKGDDWHGSIATGDLGRMDEDGYYYITGRIKRCIKIAGHRVNLDEIDTMIMDTLHIQTVSSGADDQLVIFVTGEAEKEAVNDFVRKNVPIVRPGLKVIRIDEFPVNESGKIKYGVLRDIAINGN